MSDALGQLSELANSQHLIEDEIKHLEEKLDIAKKDLRNISENQIPELMESLGIYRFSTSTGLKIELKQKIFASISKDKMEEACTWLRLHGHERIIKESVSIFGIKKGDMEYLEKHFNGNTILRESKIHPQTLSAFAREKLEMGEEIPIDLFGVYRRRFSEITLS